MLNPALNPAALTDAYGHERRILIRDVLAPETADQLAHCLREEVPWGLATLLDGQGRSILAPELQAMKPAEWQTLLARVHEEARAGYQFLYNTYQMVTAWKEKRDPDLFLHRFFEFMNSPPVLDFVRRVTGHADIAKADAQATRYLPGHFLRRHNDLGQAGPTDSRRAAYVFNMTRNWQADWGGLLQFLDDDGQIEESWLPGYNALVLFSVPAWHCVSCVAPFVNEPRLAVTGWFRTH
ncbi:MAG: 2OG-Fe(II) oxygenase [Gammaproteobacteria bacterium]